MNREHEKDSLIDLGAASIETKGPTVGQDDNQSGLIPLAGLSNE
jgi:hypothetical protein